MINQNSKSFLNNHNKNQNIYRWALYWRIIAGVYTIKLKFLDQKQIVLNKRKIYIIVFTPLNS